MKLTRLLLVAALALTTTFAMADPPKVPDGPTMATAVRLRVPAVEFKGVPLSDVFDFMRDTDGLNLYINWPALEAAGIDRSTPISIKLRNIQLSKVLDLTCGQISPGHAVTWYVSDNIIYITTRELADHDLITRVYPVQDLLVDIPNFTGPTFQLQGGGGDDGGAGTSAITGGGSNPTGSDGTTMQERGEKLVQLVMMLVSPEVWVENGGFSRIRYFNGTLIVTAPRSVHAQIGK